jgi:hypothetical protein
MATPDLSDHLAKIERAIGRVEGTVEAIKETLERGANTLERHDQRITKLEHGNLRNTSFTAGVSSVFGAAIGAVAAKLGLPWLAPHP